MWSAVRIRGLVDGEDCCAVRMCRDVSLHSAEGAHGTPGRSALCHALDTKCKTLVLGRKLRLVNAARYRASAGHAGNADTGTSACRLHRLHSRQSGRLAPRQRSLQARPGRQRLAAAPVAEAAVAEKPESAQQSAVRSAAHAVFSKFPTKPLLDSLEVTLALTFPALHLQPCGGGLGQAGLWAGPCLQGATALTSRHTEVQLQQTSIPIATPEPCVHHLIYYLCYNRIIHTTRQDT
jgi:hypothetical protein